MNIAALMFSKTFWLGVSTIIGGAVLLIHKDWANGAQAVVGGLGMIFIKDAIINSSK